MITEDEVEKAIRWMASTDIRLGELKTELARAEYLAEVAEAMVYKHLEGGVEDRKKAAKASTEVAAAMEKVFSANQAYEVLRAQRKSAEFHFSFWQSVNANRRQARVV